MKICKELSDVRVLVVDDQKGMLMIAREALIILGYRNANITTAASLDEAIEAIRAKEFDLVLTDFNIPDGSEGEEIARFAKESAKMRNMTTIVVVMSGRRVENASQIKYMLQSCEADQFLAKPFMMNDLRQILKKVIEVPALVA